MQTLCRDASKSVVQLKRPDLYSRSNRMECVRNDASCSPMVLSCRENGPQTKRGEFTD